MSEGPYRGCSPATGGRDSPHRWLAVVQGCPYWAPVLEGRARQKQCWERGAVHLRVSIAACVPVRLSRGLSQASYSLSELYQDLVVGVQAHRYTPRVSSYTSCTLAFHHCSRASFLKGEKLRQQCEKKNGPTMWHPRAATSAR
jgi:hypothetical protein